VAVSIGEFLNELGLDRYLDAFAAADVDFETLADLTDSDLQALGMTLVHRFRGTTHIRQPHQSCRSMCE